MFPGERLVVCRNPAVAAERARKREALLQATEAELAKVTLMVQGPRGSLRNAEAGQKKHQHDNNRVHNQGSGARPPIPVRLDGLVPVQQKIRTGIGA